MILWTIACQASLFMRFPSLEYWSVLPFPPSGIFLTQGSNPHLLRLPHWQADSLSPSHLGTLRHTLYGWLKVLQGFSITQEKHKPKWIVYLKMIINTEINLILFKFVCTYIFLKKLTHSLVFIHSLQWIEGQMRGFYYAFVVLLVKKKCWSLSRVQLFVTP